MIVAGEAREYVPFGREYSHHHPGLFQIQVDHAPVLNSVDVGFPLSQEFKNISLLPTPAQKDRWLVKKCTNASGLSCTEELYISEHTVIWSRGSGDNAYTVVKTCTMDSPVMQALWCTFILPKSGDVKLTRENGGKAYTGEEQTGICVIEAFAVSMFTENGDFYSTALPFQISKAWPMKHGLLFERMITDNHINSSKRNSANQTTMFSMLHPLDEVAPVLHKTSGSGGSTKVNYVTDITQVLVYTSETPSIALLYDTMLGVHSVWSIRSPKQDEIYTATGYWEGNSFYHPSGIMTPGQGHNHSSSNQSKFMSTFSSQSSSLSPLRSMSARIGSPGFLSHMSPDPVHAPFSHLNSPLSLLHSPTASPRAHTSPGNFYRTPGGKSQQLSLIDSFTECNEPLTPEVCMEQLWTETAPAIRIGSLGKARKAFLMRDVCGQQYMCYHIAFRNQLRCVKFVESNDLTQLIFGASNVILAKDAQPVPNLNLLIVLDVYGYVMLYTGVTKLNKIHVPNMPLSSMTPASTSLLQSVTPVMASPGHIVTSSRPSSADDAHFADEVQLISPVPTEMDDSQLEDSTNQDLSITHSDLITGIRDCVDNTFTLELINGNMCHSTLPVLCSSIGIDLCLKALKYVLPRDTAILFLSQWYQYRNCPGGITNNSEWCLFYECLLSQMGYNTSRLALTCKADLDVSISPVTSKRPRHTQLGTDQDWEHLLESEHHAMCHLPHLIGLDPSNPTLNHTTNDTACDISTKAPLFIHIPSITFALHLVYEDLKLSTSLFDEFDNLCPLLLQLALDLKLASFTDQYRRDLPRLFNVTQHTSQINEEALSKMQYMTHIMKDPPNVHEWLCDSLLGKDCQPLPYIPNVTIRIKNIVCLYALLLNNDLTPDNAIEKCLTRIAQAGLRAPSIDVSLSKSFTVSSSVSPSQRVVLYMAQLGVTKEEVEMMPVGVAVPLMDVIFHCRQNPPSDWPEKAFILIGRQDLSKLMSTKSTEATITQKNSLPKPKSEGKKEEDDGMSSMDLGDQFLRMRFATDLRVNDVKRFLQSSHPVRISVIQRPEVSDHDFVEEQEYFLLTSSIRTMALPVGRGMFTLHTHNPLLTETLPIPKLCLTGRAPPRNTTVEMTHIEVPTNMTAWPAYHNGVAAGLRICASSKIDSAWILYNKPKTELTNEYGGFLMALGLNGHILNLETLNIHDYLAKGHEMTSIGLILGLAAAKRGTMDMSMTRVLSIHLSALLPPTTTELNVAHNLQVASVLGLGLVFQGTSHSHISEVLLSEIGRGPGPELENCKDRESYSLAAGLAFGLVMFGKGCTFGGVAHIDMADQLCQYMVGGYRRPEMGNRDRFHSPSYQVKEGQTVNVNVTSPGATLALGMLFFNTNNSVVAQWLAYPDTQYMLNLIRPDFLLLRTLSRSLVMWASIEPTLHWIESHIPTVVQTHAFKRPDVESDDDDDIDYETISQAYCNTLAGACVAVGLKFAGSSNQQAFSALMSCMKKMLSISTQSQLCEQAGKNTVESAICVIVTSLAMVMAGSGNLDVLRVCRMLRKRIGPHYTHVTYGSHMAVAMSMGLLFIGGGRYSISTSNEAIGALICSFFPVYPRNSRDNRYHLQAFRHLYMLATEPRAILPVDVDSGFPCYVPLEIIFKDTVSYKNIRYTTDGPLTLPELNLIKQIKVLGPRYWPIVFDCDKNWQILKNLLEKDGILYVKQRAGHLSYTEDPKGYRGLLTKSLTCDQSSHVTFKPEQVKCFTSDIKLLTFSDYFTSNNHENACAASQQLSNILYECVTQEKPEAIHAHIFLSKIVKSLSTARSSMSLWQVKLICAYYDGCLQNKTSRNTPCLIHPEFIHATKADIDTTFDKWQQDPDHNALLTTYIQGHNLSSNDSTLLATYLQWYDIPSPNRLTKIFSAISQMASDRLSHCSHTTDGMSVSESTSTLSHHNITAHIPFLAEQTSKLSVNMSFPISQQLIMLPRLATMLLDVSSVTLFKLHTLWRLLASADT